jgi:hypothetical protein
MAASAVKNHRTGALHGGLDHAIEYVWRRGQMLYSYIVRKRIRQTFDHVNKESAKYRGALLSGPMLRATLTV